MIVVGRVLGRDGALSKLYDESFSTGFRAARKSDGFRGRTAIFALTAAAAHKAAEIAAGLDEAMVILPEKHAGAVHAARLVTYPEGDFAGALGRAWNAYDGLVMVMAAGIRVVRHIGSALPEQEFGPGRGGLRRGRELRGQLAFGAPRRREPACGRRGAHHRRPGRSSRRRPTCRGSWRSTSSPRGAATVS